MGPRDRSSSRRSEKGRRPRPPGPKGGRGGADGAPKRTAAPPAEPGPSRDLVYGRNAVREALRGPRRVYAVHATDAAAKEGWSGAPLKRATAEELTARCGTDAHQGVCADVEPYRYADAAELLAREAPGLVALD